jgi:predicted aspartyl protease
MDRVEVRAGGREVQVVVDAGGTSIVLDGLGAIVRLLGVEARGDDLVVI